MSLSSIDWSASAAALVAVVIGAAMAGGLAGSARLRGLARVAFSERHLGRTMLAAGLLSVLFLQVVAAHDEDGWFGQSTAAWLQAVGSVAAVLWGVWLFRAEGRRRAHDQRESLSAVGRAGVTATRYAAEQIQHLEGRDQVDPLWFERLEWVGELLGQVPVLSTGDVELIDMVVAARSRLRQAARQAERLNKSRRGGVGSDAEDAHRQLAVLHRKIAADLKKVAPRYPSQ